MNKSRLKILSKAEINELYNVPLFSFNEKQSYFALNEKEYQIMSQKGTLASKVHFILQLGYFKATSQFFNCTFTEVKKDVNFILQEYFNNAIIAAENVSKQTRHDNQDLILDLLKFNSDKAFIKEKLTKSINIKIMHSTNPHFLFQEILTYSAQNKLMLMGYSTLQDLIGDAITNEQERLGKIIQRHLPNYAWNSINELLDVGDNLYLLTALAKEPKNFKYKQIMGEVKKQQDNEKLYQVAVRVLPKLKLSKKNIAYYASLAMHYPISKLKKLTATVKALYILCYVQHRYQKINDNLVVSLFHYVNKYKDEAKLRAKEIIFDEKIKVNEDSKKAGVVLRFFDDDSISDADSFGEVRKKAYKYIAKGRYGSVADYLDGVLFDFQQTRWNEVEKLKIKVTKNMRPIFKSIEFTNTQANENLVTAIQFLKNYFKASTSNKKSLIKNAPIGCIPEKWQKHLMIKQRITEEAKDDESTEIVNIHKYEFMIYYLIMLHIESGQLHIDDSISFKSFSSYLVNDKRWENKDALLKKLGNEKLLTPIDKVLEQMEDELEKLITHVNKKIKSGNNKGIKIKQDGDTITFTLPYPKTADKPNHPMFKQVTQLSIAKAIQFAQLNCDFMQAFTHIKPYKAKDKIDSTAIMACIIANGTNLGINKMAETSDMNFNRMQSQQKNFIRLETLQEANDYISNAIADLPIFPHWNISDDRIHASVDGQKFETRLQSFIARYSSKYFGLSMGVVSYTLVANHVPINSKIISANHHESHYLFDILYNNTSNIEVDWLSGDGHASNSINHSLLDFIGKKFAPHIKRINQKTETLHGFKNVKEYNELLIKPKKKINKKLIQEEWDNIQRIVASLLLGETSQYLIAEKLSSYKRSNNTRDALWQYDKIHMSIYLLNFINDQTMRTNIRRSLNRGESFHALRRAIANVHGHKFRGTTEQEIEIWNQSARLLANCIIYYNAKLLSTLLVKFQKTGDEKLVEELKYISPAAWRHVNLSGYYTFEGHELNIDMGSIAEGINMRVI